MTVADDPTRLADRLAIHELRAGYTHHYDSGDLERFVALFAEDGLLQLAYAGWAKGRDELRAKLRVTLASRMASMDAELVRIETEIAELTGAIDASTAEVETLDATQHALTERGYELDRTGQAANARANSAAVELERAAARERGNTERVAELESRLAGTQGRFSRDDVLTAILQPSKDISNRYRTTLLETAEGKVYQGLVIYEAVDSMILQTGPAAVVRLVNKQVVGKRLTDVSLMPAGLLDMAKDEEIADLYAYLKSLGGPEKK